MAVNHDTETKGYKKTKGSWDEIYKRHNRMKFIWTTREIKIF
jgi:hypothetical protein